LGEAPCTNDLICYKSLSPGGRKQSAQKHFLNFLFPFFSLISKKNSS